MDTCGAMSQGMIGYWLETEINRILTEMNSDRTVGLAVLFVILQLLLSYKKDQLVWLGY
jgi:carbamate kinase